MLPTYTGLAHRVVSKLPAVKRATGSEEGLCLDCSFLDVLGNSLCGGEMDADGTVLVAFSKRLEASRTMLIAEYVDIGRDPD